MPPLILHETAGNGFSERAEAINAGQASLFAD
jgi:tRNA1(Val) A37 N6-methylase TrmN6